MRKINIILKIVAMISICFAAFGFYYNFMSLIAVSAKNMDTSETPYFYPAFFLMSAICIICHTILLICGIQFFRVHTKIFPVFMGILIFEVLYSFLIGILWLVPNIGLSIAAATGVANGGLSFQLITLFFVWAPLLVLWAKRKIAKFEQISNQA
jgi:hypothetical protein